MLCMKSTKFACNATGIPAAKTVKKVFPRSMFIFVARALVTW